MEKNQSNLKCFDMDNKYVASELKEQPAEGKTKCIKNICFL